MRTKHIGVGVAILVIGLASVSPAIAESTSPPVPVPGPDPAVAHLASEKGISLTEAGERIQWQERAPALDDALKRAMSPDRYGGVWIGGDDRIKVGIVQDEAVPFSEARSTVRAHAAAQGIDAVTDIKSVDYSLASLVAANDWLGRQLIQVNKNARWPVETSYTHAGGFVELKLPSQADALTDALTDAQEAVVRTARERYGGMLRTTTYSEPPQEEQCAFPYCFAPLRAGVATHPVCTLGFLARSNDDNRLYALTAGHCLEGRPNTMWYTLLPNGERKNIGRTHRYLEDHRGDSGIIRVEETGWSPRAWVYVLASPSNGGVDGTVRNTRYPIYGRRAAVLGDRVCHTGKVTGTSCGAVTRLDASQGGVLGLVQAAYCSTEGDSGGPVYARNAAFGIHRGGESGCVGYYMRIHVAESHMNVHISFDAR